MNKDLATLILSRCFTSTEYLNDIVHLLEEHVHDEDRQALLAATEQIIQDITTDIYEYVGSRNPEAYAEAERRIREYEYAF